MRFRRPVVLLLGGMLVASGIGCSAASALMGDYEPASSARQASADRMLAICNMHKRACPPTPNPKWLAGIGSLAP
ncbi:MAG: hypothetical protein ACKPHU_22300, partial [Planctomycetaceae bacterium]